ncbi:hypothetical protein DFH29DRAFT_1073197 [Suillus ampliporus]|nr:hypothetical protein DFH29DRAFT_1073197 [Suillus ampliporus]
MSSSTQDLIPQLHLGSTFGALLICATIAAILFGVTNIQAFVYFQTHRDTGRTFYKLVVIGLCALTEIVWSFKLQIVIDVPIIYGVHLQQGTIKSFLYNSSSGTFVTSKYFSLDLKDPSGVAITLLWAIYQCHVFTDLIKTVWSTYMTLGTITSVDFMIASSLCYLLATSRTGFSSGLVEIQVYVNSFLALLNASYYLRPNASTIDSSESRMRHAVYHSDLHVRGPQDEELQASWKNMFKYPDDKVAHPTRSVTLQRPIEVMVEMNSFSSV